MAPILNTSLGRLTSPAGMSGGALSMHMPKRPKIPGLRTHTILGFADGGPMNPIPSPQAPALPPTLSPLNPMIAGPLLTSAKHPMVTMTRSIMPKMPGYADGGEVDGGTAAQGVPPSLADPLSALQRAYDNLASASQAKLGSFNTPSAAMGAAMLAAPTPFATQALGQGLQAAAAQQRFNALGAPTQQIQAMDALGQAANRQQQMDLLRQRIAGYQRIMGGGGALSGGPSTNSTPAPTQHGGPLSGTTALPLPAGSAPPTATNLPLPAQSGRPSAYVMYQLGLNALMTGDASGAQLMRTATEMDPSLAGAMSGSKAAAEAPYKIAASLANQAGRAVAVNPEQTVHTGMDVMPPELAQFMRGIVLGNQPMRTQGAVTGPAPQVAPRQIVQASPTGAPSIDTTGFPTRPIAAPGGGIQSAYSPEGMMLQKEVLPKQFEEAAKQYQNAQGIQTNLDMIDHSIESLNRAGWSSTGPGANVKMGVARGVNSLLDTLQIPAADDKGQSLRFDPQKIADWESFNKSSTRMGFELAKSLGSREAMMIVQQAIAAVPNAQNTYLGARLVSSSLRQAAQRQSDFYEFLQQQALQKGGSTFGADIAFNKLHPVKQYTEQAIVNAVPEGARTELLAAPTAQMKTHFDDVFGAGSADRVLQANKSLMPANAGRQ